MPGPTCHLHPEQPAVGTCFTCLRPICEACTVHEGVSAVCPGCARRGRRGRRVRRFVLTAAILAVAGSALGVVFLSDNDGEQAAVVRPDAAPAAPQRKEEPFDHKRYGSHATRVLELRDRLEKQPCDAEATVEYGRILLEVREYREAAERMDAFIGRCPGSPDGNVLLVAYWARDYLADHDAAADLAARLIELEPDDAEAWFRRGSSLQRGKQLEAAIVHLRQAIALEPDLRRVPVNLYEAYRDAARPCEAVVTLDRYLDLRPELIGDEDFRRRVANARLNAKDCGDLEGKGKATLRFPAGAGTIEASAKINGTVVSVLVEPSAPLVILSKRLAERIGVTPGAEVKVNVLGALTPARLATVDRLELAGTSAQRLEAAIVDELAGGVEACVGTSYLWRFEQKLDHAAGRLQLRARPRRRAEP